MRLDEIPSGSEYFVDANIFIYLHRLLGRVQQIPDKDAKRGYSDAPRSKTTSSGPRVSPLSSGL